MDYHCSQHEGVEQLVHTLTFAIGIFAVGMVSIIPMEFIAEHRIPMHKNTEQYTKANTKTTTQKPIQIQTHEL